MSTDLFDLFSVGLRGSEVTFNVEAKLVEDPDEQRALVAAEIEAKKIQISTVLAGVSVGIEWDDMCAVAITSL